MTNGTCGKTQCYWAEIGRSFFFFFEKFEKGETDDVSETLGVHGKVTIVISGTRKGKTLAR